MPGHHSSPVADAASRMTPAFASEASFRRCSTRATSVDSGASSQMPTNGTPTCGRDALDRLSVIWPRIDGIDDRAVSLSDYRACALGYRRVHAFRHLQMNTLPGPRRWSGDTPHSCLRISSLRITTAPGRHRRMAQGREPALTFLIPENPRSRQGMDEEDAGSPPPSRGTRAPTPEARWHARNQPGAVLRSRSSWLGPRRDTRETAATRARPSKSPVSAR